MICAMIVEGGWGWWVGGGGWCWGVGGCGGGEVRWESEWGEVGDGRVDGWARLGRTMLGWPWLAAGLWGRVGWDGMGWRGVG